MDNLEKNIGNNIKEVRLSKGLSQEALAERCKFSNTTLSAYENGRKNPGLATTAKIAKALNVSIERLYYGDENNAFIKVEPDKGKKIVNAICYLWAEDVISYYENLFAGMPMNEYISVDNPKGFYLAINKYELPIKRLINSLNELKRNYSTYADPDTYIEMLKSSVAAEINNM